MRAGEMKYRLQLLKPTATTNDYGEEATTYEPKGRSRAETVARKWANISPTIEPNLM